MNFCPGDLESSLDGMYCVSCLLSLGGITFTCTDSPAMMRSRKASSSSGGEMLSCIESRICSLSICSLHPCSQALRRLKQLTAPNVFELPNEITWQEAPAGIRVKRSFQGPHLRERMESMRLSHESPN